jgi:hypothetical protein
VGRPITGPAKVAEYSMSFINRFLNNMVIIPSSGVKELFFIKKYPKKTLPVNFIKKIAGFRNTIK